MTVDDDTARIEVLGLRLALASATVDNLAASQVIGEIAVGRHGRAVRCVWLSRWRACSKPRSTSCIRAARSPGLSTNCWKC